jgi:hypothetical protein
MTTHNFPAVRPENQVSSFAISPIRPTGASVFSAIAGGIAKWQFGSNAIK